LPVRPARRRKRSTNSLPEGLPGGLTETPAFARGPKEAQCYAALQTGFARERGLEEAVRIHAWHLRNHRHRNLASSRLLEPDLPEWADNARALLGMLDASQPQVGLMVAELHRHLGAFDEARRVLDAIGDADLPGWGLVHLLGGKPLDPPSEASDVPVVMTDWELHDFGVQVVRDWVAKEGARIMSSQGNPDVDPSLWFVRDRGPEWVVVRTVRYPDRGAPRPDNLDEIAAGCARLSRFGHFASVAVVSTSQPFRDAHEATVPLLRGGPMHARFTGLEPLAP
jgi:hypothetical protein